MADLTLAAGDNGRNVDIAAGSNVTVSLEENPTTGYTWAVDGSLPMGVSLAGDESVPTGAAPGAGGIRRLTLHVGDAGGGLLTLKRWREWQGDASVVERFRVMLRIG